MSYKLYVKRFKIHYMVIRFFAYIYLTTRRLPLQEVCQVDIMSKRQLKHYRQLLDEKSLFSSMQGTFYSFKHHRMAPSSLLG
jgi:hypothetical protein